MNRLHQAIQEGGGGPLLGAALYFYDPVFLEIAAYTGFKVIWIEMEHAAISFAEAADLCRMAAGTGMLTMIRIPDTRRESVLKAAECGPDIIDVPMADTTEHWQELVKYSRFAPGGSRGHFGVSRALKYGLVDDVPAEQQRLNRDLSLLAQVETAAALAQIEELTAVPGVDLFIGPADLAASLGVPGQTGHPEVLAAGKRIIETARRHGKKIATACGAADYPHWIRMGVDLLFCTNDIVCLKMGARAALKSAMEAMERVDEERAIDQFAAARDGAE
jgi:2-keto-3-deoxy-L-rhamnonate aldolase RhmA